MGDLYKTECFLAKPCWPYHELTGLLLIKSNWVTKGLLSKALPNFEPSSSIKWSLEKGLKQALVKDLPIAKLKMSLYQNIHTNLSFLIGLKCVCEKASSCQQSLSQVTTQFNHKFNLVAHVVNGITDNILVLWNISKIRPTVLLWKCNF